MEAPLGSGGRSDVRAGAPPARAGRQTGEQPGDRGENQDVHRPPLEEGGTRRAGAAASENRPINW
jgi:hypothetical protein